MGIAMFMPSWAMPKRCGMSNCYNGIALEEKINPAIGFATNVVWVSGTGNHLANHLANLLS